MIQIGWREWVGLPDLGITRLKAKIDTGARTSCLHAFRIETFERDNQPWVRFWIHPSRHHPDRQVCCEARVIDERFVTDSGGHKEKRLVIQTRIVIGGMAWPVEVTLSNRDSMMFRMLIGRTALAQRVTINPASSYVTGKPRRGKYENCDSVP